MDFNDELEFAMSEIQGSSGYSLDRNRPYDGQLHTGDGVRGSQMVEDLTMRDVRDCMVKAMLGIGSIDRENPILDDIYKVDFSDIDPGALLQCMGCEMEKMMGIYPNVPKLYDADGNEL